MTGFEKGSIVVWHNIVQYYLSALSQTLNSATTAPAVDSTRYDKLSICVDAYVAVGSHPDQNALFLSFYSKFDMMNILFSLLSA